MALEIGVWRIGKLHQRQLAIGFLPRQGRADQGYGRQHVDYRLGYASAISSGVRLGKPWDRGAGKRKCQPFLFRLGDEFGALQTILSPPQNGLSPGGQIVCPLGQNVGVIATIKNGVIATIKTSAAIARMMQSLE